MCSTLAVAIAGLALSAAGTLYSASQNAGYAADRNKAEQDKQAASAAARDAEEIRQKGFEKESNAAFQEQLQAQAPQTYADVQKAAVQETLDTTKDVREQSHLDQGLLPGQTGDKVSDVFTKEATRVGAEKMADAQKRINALAAISGYDRANGYTDVSSNRYNADQRGRALAAQRSLRLGIQEGQVPAPFVGSPSQYGAAATTLGNAGLALGGRYGAWDDLKSIFTSTPQLPDPSTTQGIY